MRTDILEQAKAIRASMDIAAGFLTDLQAAKAPMLYPAWSADGVKYKIDDRVYYPETRRLYKVVTSHTSQESWSPNVTPALFTIIEVEHAGTKDDPITAARGMEYVYGLYYTDPEDNKLYLCQRTGESSGGKITLQYLPHELIGQYFTEVTQENPMPFL